jgi:Tfp pilus assembly protein PilN
MPDEVLIARRTEALRQQILFALVGLVALLVAWYAVVWFGTHSSNNDLDDANHRTTALVDQQRQYQPLVSAQNDAAAIQTQLRNLMVGDLQWRSMLATLRAQGGKDVDVTGVTGTITSGAASAAGGTTGSADGIDVLNQTGKQQVGTLTITGTAHDKNSVAAFVDRLGKVTGLASPLPTSLTTANGTMTFTINVVVTTDALGGRYATQAPQQGGK